jgi:hypothetical protein
MGHAARKETVRVRPVMCHGDRTVSVNSVPECVTENPRDIVTRVSACAGATHRPAGSSVRYEIATARGPGR